MIGQFGGRIIDTAGDGILAEFNSVSNAVECAVAIQDTMRSRNSETEAHRKMQYRIGINLGDVIYDDSRIYGDGINVAARLESRPSPEGSASRARCMKTFAARSISATMTWASSASRTLPQSVRCYQVSGIKRTTYGSETPRHLRYPANPPSPSCLSRTCPAIQTKNISATASPRTS